MSSFPRPPVSLGAFAHASQRMDAERFLPREVKKEEYPFAGKTRKEKQTVLKYGCDIVKMGEPRGDPFEAPLLPSPTVFTLPKDVMTIEEAVLESAKTGAPLEYYLESPSYVRKEE